MDELSILCIRDLTMCTNTCGINSSLGFNSSTVGSGVSYASMYVCVCVCVYIYLGHAVAQLVEALRYMPEGREFDSRWCHWNFSLT